MRQLSERLVGRGQDDARPSVRRLIRTLRKDPDPNQRAGAAKQLGQAGDRRGLAPLCDAARTGDQTVRRAACEALGNLGIPDAVSTLDGVLQSEPGLRTVCAEALAVLNVEECLRLASHPTREVRVAVLCALANVQDERVVPVLQHALRDEHTFSAAFKGLALAAGQATTESSVKEAVRSLDAERRERLPEHLLRLINDNLDETEAARSIRSAAIGIISELMVDGNTSVRSKAMATALKARDNLAAQTLVGHVVAALQHPDPAVRRDAALRIEFISWGERPCNQSAVRTFRRGKQPWLPLLLQAVDDPDPDVRRDVVGALVRMTNTAKAEPIARALADPDERVRDAAIRASANLPTALKNEALVNHLETELGADDARRRQAAVERLGEVHKSSRAIDLVVSCLDDPDSRVRLAATRSLHGRGGSGVVDLLSRLLLDRNSGLRRAAASSLNGRGEPTTKALSSILLGTTDDLTRWDSGRGTIVLSPTGLDTTTLERALRLETNWDTRGWIAALLLQHGASRTDEIRDVIAEVEQVTRLPPHIVEYVEGDNVSRLEETDLNAEKRQKAANLLRLIGTAGS